MDVRHTGIGLLLLAIGVFGLAGCEPYLSMTDPIPAQTRRAASLLPGSPRYVGMVEVTTAFQHLNDLSGKNFADSLRQTKHPYIRTFLDATGLDLEKDIHAVYGTLGGGDEIGLVMFANLAPQQMDRYLTQAPGDAGRRFTYRGVPFFHLALPDETKGGMSSSDSLSIAFVENETLAISMDADRVRRMVDRHRAKEKSGLRANSSYMTLIKRVGRGSTAWVVGRDVVESALQDTAGAGDDEAMGDSIRVNQAGLQHALTEWSDRVLGLSEVSSNFQGRASKRVGELKKRLRAQALSLTFTDTALEGEVYLTMRDKSSASSVVDVAEGAVAVLKLSGDDLDERHRDLLDEIAVERHGPIVHIHFSLQRDHLRERMRGERRAAVHRRETSVHRWMTTARRQQRILQFPRALNTGDGTDATDPTILLSLNG